MKIPSIELCEKIIEEYKVSSSELDSSGIGQKIVLLANEPNPNPNEIVMQHTFQVRKIANFLAKKISEKNLRVDLNLVDRAALMHDFVKLHGIVKDRRHTLESEKIMSEKGFSEFGEVLKHHGLDEVLNFDENTLLESKIVWYADKRVNHDKIVSLEERYEYLKERYGTMSKEKMKEIISTEQAAKELEKEILELADVSEKLEGIDA